MLNLNNLNLLGNTQSTKLFHTSIVLSAEKVPTDNLETATDIRLTVEHKSKLLAKLNEIQQDSESMTLSEFLAENFTSFDEALPNCTLKKALDEINTANNLNSVFEEPLIKEVLQPLSESTNSFLFDQDPLISYLKAKNISADSFSALLQKLQINTEVPEVNTVDSESNSPLIAYNNGILSVNTSKTGELFRTSIDYYLKHQDKIDIATTGILLPGIGSYFLYKNVVKLYAATAFQDVNKLNIPENEKYQFLKSQARQVKFFNGVGALLIVSSLFVISNTIIDSIRTKHPFSVEITNTDKPTTSILKSISIFTLLGKFKVPNCLKYLLILVVVLIVFYYLLPYVPVLLTSHKDILVTWLKFISIFVTSLLILYNLITLFFLIKFSQMENTDIIIPRYVPNFIRTYLLEIIEISKFKSLSYFIDMYVRSSLILFVIFVIFLLITNFLAI